MNLHLPKTEHPFVLFILAKATEMKVEDEEKEKFESLER